MWIVKLALNRPYTFIVLALLILILSPVAIMRTPTDIFPSINIPVVAVAWTYTGLNPEEMEGRVTTVFERALTTTVDNIEHIESTTVNGTAIVKIYLQPSASIDRGNAQITAISQSILKQLPPGSLPPLIVDYNASTVPILQLGLSGNGLTEPQLNDIALNFLRTQLVTVPGAAVPYPYGGKTRQVMVNINPNRLQAKGLSPSDVLTALGNEQLILPGGTAKIGQFEYDVDLNADLKKVSEFNDLPIKRVGNTIIYLRDVATVSDGFAPQTNIVRQDGKRGALVTVLKAGDASTLDVVKGVRQLLPRVAQTLPPQLHINPLADQSLFVRASIDGVIKEATIAACLTGLMILLFLGNWRSTVIIAVSIPLSILTSIIVLSALGETINIMTLGGLALAVGILVDDATVEIENINRNIDQGKEIVQAILDGAQQIAVPALVSTLSICIVFVPMFFLSGVARYLFVPLAEAVCFAMLASYLLSRTLVPTMAKYLLVAQIEEGHEGAANSRNPFVQTQQKFEQGFEKLRERYHRLLEICIHHSRIFVICFFSACVVSFVLLPMVGQDFFPAVDSGEFKLHLRAPTGTRIEETAALCERVDDDMRQLIPKSELTTIIDNIGVPYSGLNLSYSNSAPIGPGDADILVELSRKHRPTEEYVHDLRERLNRDFPGVTFYFLPADIVSQILNFGLPAPIDIQVVGRNLAGDREFADKLMNQLKFVPGTTDLRIQQPFDQPKLHFDVDRTKAQEIGYSQQDVANNLLISLSGSFQTVPSFWLDPKTGVTYNIAAQMPQYRIDTLQDLQNIPVTGRNPNAPPAIFASLASVTRGAEMGVVSHYNVQPVIDIYGAVQGRDLGGVARDIAPIIERSKKDLPRGSQLIVRGQISTMQSSFSGLLWGLAFSIVLVYLLIVVNFQSWLDPFIILMALPAALAGIVWFLFITRTTVSVPALTGAIMCMGVATANSILVVSFSKERLGEGKTAAEAASESGFTRFRPVLMTALAMIIGMLPMSLGLGEGGEQNAPLGRAVIGGLMFATVATLFFVPVTFSIVHGAREKKPAAAPDERLAD